MIISSLFISSTFAFPRFTWVWKSTSGLKSPSLIPVEMIRVHVRERQFPLPFHGEKVSE